jgi:hypothetical protein
MVFSSGFTGNGRCRKTGNLTKGLMLSDAKVKYFWRNDSGKIVPFPVDKEKRRAIRQERLDSAISDWLFWFPSASRSLQYG